LRRITPAPVERFRAELAQKLTIEDTIRTRTVNKCIALLVLMFGYAERHGWVSANPVKHVKRLRVESRQVEPLSPEEVAQLLEHAADPWRPLLAVACMSGARQGEVLALTWDDVDLAARKIHVRRSFSGGRLSEPKTAAGARTVSIPETLVAILRAWKLKCPVTKLDLCFPSKMGKHLDAGQVIRAGLRPALKRAGLRQIRFHDLRHGYASALLASGVDVVRVSKALGHASPQVTMTVYAHTIAGLGQHVGEHVEALYAGLAVASGSKTVAAAGSGDPSVDGKPAQVIDFQESARGRT
jgi:integrase